MPKLKTKSACKKRFKLTGTGKLRRFGANHNHFMRNKTRRALKNATKAMVICSENASTIKKWMPYASKFSR